MNEYVPEDAEEAAAIEASKPRWDHIDDVMKPADGWELGFCDTHLCHGECGPEGMECAGLCFDWTSAFSGRRVVRLSHEREAEDVILSLMKLRKNGKVGEFLTVPLDFNDLLGLQLAVDIAVRRYKHWDKTFDWSIEK